MLSEKLKKVLEDLSNEESTNKKIEKLSNYLKDEEINEILLQILHKTYDKRQNRYYMDIKTLEKIKKQLKPKETSQVDKNIIQEVLNELEKISNKVPLRERITGHAAMELVIENLNKLDKNMQDIFIKVINRDLKIGMNIKNINKAIENAELNKIYTTPYHGAEVLKLNKLRKNLKKYDNLIVDEKMDGMYAAIGKNYSESRAGNTLHLDFIFNDLINEFNKNNEDNILIGELLLKGFDRKTANGIINSYTSILQKLNDYNINYEEINSETINTINNLIKETKNKREIKLLKDLKKDIIEFKKRYEIDINNIKNDIYYVIWDIIPRKNYEKGIDETHLIKRRKKLEQFFNNNTKLSNEKSKIKLVNYIVTNNLHEIAVFLYDILQKGGEGVIVKQPDAEFKTTKSNQMKIKMEVTCDLKIVGFLPGKKGSKFENTLGSLIVKSKDGKVITQPAGISEELRDEIWNNKEKFLGKIVEVKANGITKAKDKEEYALLHPSLNEIREDKIEADSLEDILKNFNMIEQVKKLLELEHLELDKNKQFNNEIKLNI